MSFIDLKYMHFTAKKKTYKETIQNVSLEKNLRLK